MPIYFLKRKRKNPGKKNDPSRLNRRTLLLAAAFILVASLLSNLVLFRKVNNQRKTIIVQKKALSETREPDDSGSEISGHWYGLCPKNMIHSVEDFHRIVNGDPLLASHFSDFDWKDAHMGRLEKSIWTHVAYRKDGKIRTTRKVIRLPLGDGYITDGNRWVRSYCCNDYVLAEGVEQAKAKMDRDLERLMKRDTTDVVPEPDTFLLVFTGLAGLSLAGFAGRRR